MKHSENQVKNGRSRLYLRGMNLLHIGRVRGVNRQSVAKLGECLRKLSPRCAGTRGVETAELDYLYLFIGKKDCLYRVPVVDRTTRCITSWVVARERSEAT